MASMLQEFMFPAPSSWFITGMSIVYIVLLPLFGVLEAGGWHLQYSKFWNLNPNQRPLLLKKLQRTMSSRVGMVVGYSPAFLAAIASFWIFRDEGLTLTLRLVLIRSFLTIHFFKRLFESVFIHKYGSKMVVEVTIFIAFAYLMGVVSFIYAQHLTQGVAEPAVDTKHLGIVLFLVGIGGNFYHHYILSNLRKHEGDTDYKIPKGGLFGLVVCPHYLFEIIEFVGITFICQTLYAMFFTIGSALFLMGRSYATKRWYLSKFEDFPKNVKSLFPFLF